MLDFQKKKQLGILVKIAMVDEEFADEEKAVIEKISKRYGAEAEELEEIFSAPPINESLAPMTVTDKINFMMDCILVILADNVVTNSEEYFARQMAANLGFNPDIVRFLIDHKNEDRSDLTEDMLSYLIS